MMIYLIAVFGAPGGRVTGCHDNLTESLDTSYNCGLYTPDPGKQRVDIIRYML